MLARQMKRAPFDELCSQLEVLLSGVTRQNVLTAIAKSPELGKNLVRLRASMQSHEWNDGATTTIKLGHLVSALDRKTRREGLHAMHDWDGIADHVNPDMIAIDVLNYIVSIRGDGPTDPVVL